MLTQERLKEVLHYNPDTGRCTWKVSPSTHVKIGDDAGHLHNGYVRVTIDGIRIMAHRLAWLFMTGCLPLQKIDHRNGMRSDNRWGNLREGSNSFNLQNQRRPMITNTTGLLGVKRNGRGFAAKIVVNGMVHWLGTYKTAEEAHNVYIATKRNLHEGCTI